MKNNAFATNPPESCFIHAPCKINLHLEIGDRRPDSFHNLDSLFVSLAFGDDLFFEFSGENGSWDLQIKNSLPSGGSSQPAGGFSGENNLISRAVSLFREKTGLKQGIRCLLDKKIPIGAGLGGGSSDVASTLLALNSLAKTNLSRSDLLEMAISLGSDVPFFLSGGAARASGRGEQITPLPSPPEYPVILVKPPFSNETARAYRLLDQYRDSKELFLEKTLTETLRHRGREGRGDFDYSDVWNILPCEWPFFNDFLGVLPESEVYREILAGLRKEGAEFAGLSGSGSCCFGVFADRERAMTAQKKLVFDNMLGKNGLNFIQITFFLASAAIPVLK